MVVGGHDDHDPNWRSKICIENRVRQPKHETKSFYGLTQNCEHKIDIQKSLA